MKFYAVGRLPIFFLLHVGAAPTPDNLPKFYMGSHFGDIQATAGVAWFQYHFSLIDYEPEDQGKQIVTQFGMGGNWIDLNSANHPFGACGGADEHFQTFEGGAGYGAGLFGQQPKWRVGDNANCYRAYTQSNMFHSREVQPHACSWKDSDKVNPDHHRSMGLIQLSNRLMLFPDGQTFETEGMAGHAYAKTPFGKTHAQDTRNFWTVIFDSENFAGPVAYFLPEFWKLRLDPKTRDFSDLSDIKKVNGRAPAWECHDMATYVDNNVHKLIKMSMPHHNGRNLFWMGQRGHDESEILHPLEEALSQGALDASKLLSAGQRPPCHSTTTDAKFGNVAKFATSKVAMENGDCMWTLQAANSTCPRNGRCSIPQYYQGGKSIPPSQASAALRKQSFRMQKDSAQAYDALSKAPAGGCRDSPGPSDKKLYCARTIDATWVGYRWYRFVDQPGLQQAGLSQGEKDFMQQRVETLHKMLPTPVSHWINGRKFDEPSAKVDPAAIATPPSGMEHGYVPIILYQGLKKPAECSHMPKARSPSPPTAYV